MKKVKFLLLVTLISLFYSNLWAYPIPAKYSFKYNGFEMLNPLPTSAAWNPSGDSIQVFNNLNDGSEDNWGIAQVTSILDRTTNAAVWGDGDGGEHLTMMVGGLDYSSVTMIDTDANFIPDLFTVRMTPASTGAFMDMWLDVEGSGYTAFDPSVGPSARTGIHSYPTVTDGTLQARFVAAPGILSNPNIMTSITQDGTFPPTGKGAGYFDVVPGSGPIADFLNTNSMITALGTADVFVEFNFRPHPDQGLTNYSWTLNIEDPAIGAAIPEPATMILLGFGLIGLAGIGRNKKS